MKTMRPLLFASIIFLAALSATSSAWAGNLSGGAEGFPMLAGRIQSGEIAALPVQNNGRMKPLVTLARETLMFLTGKYQWFGLEPVQMYLGMVTQEAAADLEIIEIRDPKLREDLGFSRKQRFYSTRQLDTSTLGVLARPLAAKEEKNSRSLSPYERKVLEAFHQLNLAHAVMNGDHFLSALDFSFDPRQRTGLDPAMQSAAVNYLKSLSQDAAAQDAAARALLTKAQTAPLPPLMGGYRERLGVEMVYLRMDPFLVAATLYLIAAFLLGFGGARHLLGGRAPFLALGLAMVVHAVGFGMRVYITGFAPVTNMYGTMLWVAFGIALFSTLLYALYRKHTAATLLTAASGLLLLLTHNMPLILSPDMDPIVAVLRSNFWLTIHVLTITISYAAFSVAMLLGNAALIRSLFVPQDHEFCKTYAKLAYRMIQLGVFLISAGIILGGIWADYSWGRFWGWDPKETWALIADLGFIVILHARHVGWLKDFGTLAASTAAYLLVVMAWYGVNFVLAAGLHSYGFSSGGTAVVIGFVAAQIAILVAALLKRQRALSPSPRTAAPK